MSEYYDCECHTECINVERFIDVFTTKNGSYNHYEEIDFAIYHYGTLNHRPTLKNKLKHCWQILKTGKNYPDQIILSIDTARKLGKYLLKLTDKDEIKKAVAKEIKSNKRTK